ncbi:hypothetical protein ACU686_00575 [Yinghuangia aomiensis]
MLPESAPIPNAQTTPAIARTVQADGDGTGHQMGEGADTGPTPGVRVRIDARGGGGEDRHQGQQHSAE